MVLPGLSSSSLTYIEPPVLNRASICFHNKVEKISVPIISCKCREIQQEKDTGNKDGLFKPPVASFVLKCLGVKTKV